MYTILCMSTQAIQVTYQAVKLSCSKIEVEGLFRVNLLKVNQ